MTAIPATASERLAAVAAELWASACERFPDLIADGQALVELDDDLRGMRVHRDEVNDRFDLVWTGRLIGSVDGAYIRDGVVPS